MIRRDKPVTTNQAPSLCAWRRQLVSRRRFLIQAAGGSVALLFAPRRAPGAANPDPWPTLDAVLQHLLPSEPDSPGALEIRALDYLRFVTGDPWVDAQEREFILQGSRWLDDLSQQHHAKAASSLDDAQMEQLLREIVRTGAGENWVSTLLTYLFEALLSAPAYGGNPQGVGWRWLQYVPGFPLPGSGTRYSELPL